MTTGSAFMKSWRAGCWTWWKNAAGLEYFSKVLGGDGELVKEPQFQNGATYTNLVSRRWDMGKLFAGSKWINGTALTVTVHSSSRSEATFARQSAYTPTPDRAKDLRQTVWLNVRLGRRPDLRHMGFDFVRSARLCGDLKRAVSTPQYRPKTQDSPELRRRRRLEDGCKVQTQTRLGAGWVHTSDRRRKRRCHSRSSGQWSMRGRGKERTRFVAALCISIQPDSLYAIGRCSLRYRWPASSPLPRP